MVLHCCQVRNASQVYVCVVNPPCLLMCTFYVRAAPAAAAAAEEEEDDIDLFGSDDEEVDEAAEKLKAQRLAEYAAKKANKPKTIAKTTVTLDVKPWDDETNMEELTAAVKGIEMDGLLWGGSQLVAIGYGIKKLQINCVVEDDKVRSFLIASLHPSSCLILSYE